MTRRLMPALLMVALVGCIGPIWNPPPAPPPVPTPTPIPTPVPPPPPPDPTPPPITRPAVTWPAVGASYYTCPTDPDCDLTAYATFLAAVDVDFTQGWLLDAWAIGQRDSAGNFLRGQYDGFLPWIRGPDGRFDLTQFDPRYFARIRAFTDTLNSVGLWVEWSIYELYTWSERKAGLPFVPNQDLQPLRNNVNNVSYGHPDDPTFFAIPDAVMKSFACKVIDTLQGTSYVLKTGNEFPEKAAHFRLAEHLRSCGFTGDLIVNRQEDTPGQYWNMDIGGVFQRLELHGRLNIRYLDEEFPEEAHAGRPTTFRAMWPLVDASRVLLSSDGGGGNPALHDDLLVVFRDARHRGASVELQLALKRNRFFGDGTLRMGDLDIDRPFLQRLRQ